MSALLPGAPSLSPHALALCMLIDVYVRRGLTNSAMPNLSVATSAAAVGAVAEPLATPIKNTNGGGGGVFISPVDSSRCMVDDEMESSFFSNPSAAPTPAPKAFNLGLNLGGGGGIGNVNSGITIGNIGMVGSPSNINNPSSHTTVRSFSPRLYRSLGRLLQKAIANGGIYQQRLYEPETSSTNLNLTLPSPSSSSSTVPFPIEPPRYPTLRELRKMLLKNLPSEDNFHITVEQYLLSSFESIHQPDDLFNFITSLSSLLILYSHKIPQPSLEHPSFQVLDETSSMGMFLRQMKLTLEGGGFEEVSKGLERILRFRQEEQNQNNEDENNNNNNDVVVEEHKLDPHHPNLLSSSHPPLNDSLMYDVGVGGVAGGAGVWEDAPVTSHRQHEWKDPWSFDFVEEKKDYDDEKHADTGMVLPSSSTAHLTTRAPIPSSWLHSLLTSLPSISGRLPPERFETLLRRLSPHDGDDPTSIHLSSNINSQLILLKLSKHTMESEYLEALDQTYRYFDYGMELAASAAAASHDDDSDDSKLLSKRRPMIQQYASLSLARLHFSFGHYATCVTSLQETIKIAQQNKDPYALKYAMQLLFKIIERKVRAGGSKSDIARGCASCGVTFALTC